MSEHVCTYSYCFHAFTLFDRVTNLCRLQMFITVALKYHCQVIRKHLHFNLFAFIACVVLYHLCNFFTPYAIVLVIYSLNGESEVAQ